MRKSQLFFHLILGLLLLTVNKISSQTCPAGLVSNWKLDETSGLTLTDYKGGHNAISNVELVSDADGKVGKSKIYNFANTAHVPNHSDFAFPANSSFSIVYWLKITDVAYGTQDHVVISKGDYGGGVPVGGFWSSGVNGSGLVNFLMSDAGNHYKEIESTVSYNTGTWHQVACVRDESTNSNILYIDGAVAASLVYDYPDNFTNSSDIAFSYLISSGATGYYYKGSVDEIGIFNRALTPGELSTLITNADMGVGYCDGFNPNFSSDPKTTASVGSSYQYIAHAAGSQLDMQYSLLTSPAGMSINSTSGLITWTPPSLQANGYVQVKADNKIAPADTQSFRIFISEPPVCPSNLLLLLKLDESAGPVYADHYETHNGVASASPTATTGKINRAQLFDLTSRINITDGGSEFDWANGSSFSLECWIKTSTTAGMVAMARNRVDYNETGTSWWIGTNSSGKAAFELRDNSKTANSVLSGTKLVNDGNWHHIVAVRNGATNMNILYVDGIQENWENINYPTTFSADDPTDVTLGYMLRSTTDKPTYHFQGAIDEAAIFTRAVTASEVSTFYNSGNPSGHCALTNFAPAVTSIPPFSCNEGEVYNYTFKTEDPNLTDVLVLSTVSKPSWLNFTWTAGQKTAILTGTPGAANIGPNNVILRVSDGHVQIDQPFTITVVNTNSDPQVTSTPVTTVNEDVAYSYSIIVSDADADDDISMTVVSKPSWLDFSFQPGNRSATLSGTPGDSDSGNSTVDISITDQHTTIHHTFTLTVIAVDDPPVISAQSVLTINEDQSVTLQKANFTISDVDNPLTEVTVKIQSGTNYSYMGNTITPAANFNGQLTVNVVARDLNFDSQVFHALVTVNPVNDPPLVNSDPELNGYVGDLYAYIFTATDVDDATLTRSIVQKPDWLLFSASTGVLTGTPAAANKGDHLVILRVSDGKIDVDQDFVIHVDGPDGLEDLEAAGIRVYPVPANDYLYIRFDRLAEETRAEIFTSTGSIVKEVIIPANTNKYRVEMPGLGTGTYYIRLTNSTLNNMGRFVIIR